VVNCLLLAEERSVCGAGFLFSGGFSSCSVAAKCGSSRISPDLGGFLFTAS
jgi:hypothetical protein